MQTPKWHTSLQQLMQQQTETQSIVVVAIGADSTTTNSSSLSLSSSSSLVDSSVPTSKVNENSRSIRINPLEEEHEVNNTSREDDEEEEDDKNVSNNPAEAWLPITESRKGNMYFCIFHLISSGLGLQSLLLPVAFRTLGWGWGIAWLSMAFIWQLYTTWLLTQLHESSSGYRYSRYLQLTMAAFGPKLGKLLALFPVMYLSGGTCTTLVISGGGTMQNLYNTLCEGSHICDSKNSPITTVEWYLIFICLAIAIAQLPNLNSMAWVSLVSVITAILYVTLIWAVSLSNARPSSAIRYDVVVSSAKESKHEMGSMVDSLLAIGMVALSFRGHNLVLEIQGTLPTSPKDPPHKIMWKGVKFSNALIAMCLFPLALCGYWAYGTLMLDAGMLNTLAQFHGNRGSKLKLAMIYFFLVINCLCSFQIYAMPVFDNFELRYVTIRKKPCTRWHRMGLRTFFGGLVLFIAVAAPFLPLLASLIGGIALPITYAYPCFMWISIKKPAKFGAMWFLNLILGSLGVLLSVLLVIAAICNLVNKGLPANFFHPKP